MPPKLPADQTVTEAAAQTNISLHTQPLGLENKQPNSLGRSRKKNINLSNLPFDPLSQIGQIRPFIKKHTELGTEAAVNGWLNIKYRNCVDTPCELSL